MQPAVLLRLRPVGPWRYGPGDGGNNRVDALFRSDRLFSAFTIAAQQLGLVEEWLDATARTASPAVQFSSMFPFQGDTLFVTPPRTLWPPPAWLVTSPSPLFLTKLRWSAAQFVPFTLVESVLLGQKILADQWTADPESRCLLRRDRPSTTPFRTVLRTGAPVDRSSGRSASAYSFAAVEFESGSGLWSAIRFRDETVATQWSARVQGMVRLLGDSGFGARRSAGWGQTAAPEWRDGQWPELLFPKLARSAQYAASTDPASPSRSSQHWLLSLFSPGPNDAIDWSAGDYSLVERGTAAGSRARFVAEGSVLVSEPTPVGAAVNLNESNGRPVYRSGLALSLVLSLAEPTPEPESPGLEAVLESEDAAEAQPEEQLLPTAVESPADLTDLPEGCAADHEPRLTSEPAVEPEPPPSPLEQKEQREADNAPAGPESAEPDHKPEKTGDDEIGEDTGHAV